MAQPWAGFKTPTKEEWEEGASIPWPVAGIKGALWSMDLGNDAQWNNVAAQDQAQFEGRPLPLESESEECFDLPVELWTACQKYLYNEAMDCFFEYFQRTFGEELASPEWRRKNLLYRGWYGYTEHDMCDRRWGERHSIEMDRWVKLYNFLRHKTTMDDDSSWSILSACCEFRHDAIHRREADVKRIFFVSFLPELLGDAERARNFQRLIPILYQDEDIEPGEKAAVMKMLFPCPIIAPPQTPHELFSKIQDILEDSCFRNARQRGNSRFNCEDDMHPAAIELQEWEHDWWHLFYRTISDDELATIDETSGIDGKIRELNQLRSAALVSARRVRNMVAHRNSERGSDVLWFIVMAMLYANLLGDFPAALEIEILGECFITQRLREEVIARLWIDGADDHSRRRRAISSLPEAQIVKSSLLASFMSDSRLRREQAQSVSSPAMTGNTDPQSNGDAQLTVITWSKKPRRSPPKLNMLLKYVFSNDVLQTMWYEQFDTRISASDVAIHLFVLDKSTHPELRKYEFDLERWRSEHMSKVESD